MNAALGLATVLLVAQLVAGGSFNTKQSPEDILEDATTPAIALLTLQKGVLGTCQKICASVTVGTTGVRLVGAGQPSNANFSSCITNLCANDLVEFEVMFLPAADLFGDFDVYLAADSELFTDSTRGTQRFRVDPVVCQFCTFFYFYSRAIPNLLTQLPPARSTGCYSRAAIRASRSCAPSLVV